MHMTRVLIVEDEPLFRDLLVRALSDEPSLEIVGAAPDAAIAIRLLEREDPEAVLMDIELQGEADGIEVALRIKQVAPSSR